MGGRGVRIGRFSTAWTDVRCLTRLLPFQTNTGQETLVAQDPPQFAPHLRVISPISPASFRSPSSSSRLHRLERFSGDEGAAKGGGEYQEHIGCQMREVVVPGFILAPTPRNLPTQHG